jgi:putative endopeptidase
MNRRYQICALGMLLACTGVTAAAPSQTAPSSKPLSGPAAMSAGMYRKVLPGNDFYDFANGAWMRATQIPADRASYGESEKLSELNDQRVANLIREVASSSPPPGSDARRIADYYAAFMDEATIESRGLTNLRPTLDEIAAIEDRAALARYLGGTLRADVDILNATNLYTDNVFGVWVAQDLDDPTRYLPFLVQGGLGMPDRDFYLDESPHMAEDRRQYQSHIAAMLKLAGDSDAAKNAAAIFALELRIAQVHATREQSEDVKAGNNHWTREQFASRAPGMDWNAYFAGAALDRQADFVVWQPGAVSGIAALIGGESLDTWKTYLRFRAISHFAPFLPKAFVEENFVFYGNVLDGTPTMRARWKRAVTTINASLGDAVGKLYVARYFPPEAKAQIEDLVRNEIAAFAKRIDDLQWMAPETKTKAKAKLASLKVGVGYPDHWRDFSSLAIKRDDALGNAQRVEKFDYQRNLAKLGKPVDRSEWVMNAQLVNAVNLPAMNALNFPAAILQPPFFDAKNPAAMNYGSIGAVIGHEISHSFDDQGALFDATGRLQNWWTEADFAHFRASSEQLVRQFNSYKPFPDLSINGKQTLSENIADVAGLTAAYSAYHLSLHGQDAPVEQGLTGDQQFFISFAQSWREKIREASLRQQIATDGHAPGQYRTLTVRNIDAWYQAFGVKPDEALYLAPAERVRMW